MENKNIKNIELGLVEGRHDLPVDTFIYQEGDITFPLDMKELAKIADKRLSELGAVSSFEDRFNPTSINLYVTGLTAATTAVVRVALVKGYLLTLYHFDRDSQTWIPQTIVGKSDLHLDSDYPSIIMGGIL